MRVDATLPDMSMAVGAQAAGKTSERLPYRAATRPRPSSRAYPFSIQWQSP